MNSLQERQLTLEYTHFTRICGEDCQIPSRHCVWWRDHVVLEIQHCDLFLM